MEYKHFEEIILKLKSFDEKVRRAYDNHIDLLEFHDDLHIVINNLLLSVYDKEGVDWFDWFRFENEYGEKDWSKIPTYESKDGKIVKYNGISVGASDENGKSICYDIKSTWEFLEANHKIK